MHAFLYWRYILLWLTLATLHHYSYVSYTARKEMSANEVLPGSQGPCKRVELDGSTYEGGGGLIRYATNYASILRKPIRVRSIRANRPGLQGLRSEHTIAIDALSRLASVAVDGNTAGSGELWFTPHLESYGPIITGPAKMDITMEGAASILLIAILPYFLFSRIASQTSYSNPATNDQTLELVIRAGTLCVKAPSIFYLRQVLLPTFRLIGIGEDNVFLSKEHEQGWHTQGLKCPGKMVVRLKPLDKPLRGFVLRHRGNIMKLQATAHVPPSVRRDFKTTLYIEFSDLLSTSDPPVETSIEVYESAGRDQYHLLLSVETVSPTSFLGYEYVYPQDDYFPPEIKGDRKKIAEHLIRGCIRGLWKELRKGNAVDEYTKDILIMYQSLASGFSSVESNGNERQVPEFNSNSRPLDKIGHIYDFDDSTLHRQTSWWIANRMTGVELEHRTMNGVEMNGCVGIALGKRP